MTSFPTEVATAYRKTVAFEVPGTPEFCDRSNFFVCTQFETTASCCCSQEITEYTKCAYTNTLNTQFGSPGCEHTCGNDEEEAAGGGSMMIIIIIVAVVLGCGCGGSFYYRRRKRLAALADKDMGDRDVESGGRKKSKRVIFDDSDSESDSDFFRDNRRKDTRGKLTKTSSKNRFDSESESDDSDFSGRGKKKRDKRGKFTEQSSKKGLDSEFESDDSGYSGKKKGKLVRRNSKNNLIDSDSESSDDSESNNEKSKKKKGGSRRGHSESDSSESDEEIYNKRSRKPSKATQKENNWKKRVEEWDDSQHTKEDIKKRRNATDESVRQARTILTSYSATKDQDISSQVQAAMKTEMTDVIANMKALREVMEERLREAEKAAATLRLEQESSRKQITELETKKQAAENRLQETEKEAKMVRSNSCRELAEKEGEKITVSAELDGVRKERETMSKMIKNLEQAKQDMEGRLTEAKDEATTLKAQNEESTKRVSEVEKDRETMKLKLAQLQTTRDNIEARLKEAEEEGKQLKEERKEKSKQIKRCDNDESIHQYQSQKNTMSRELKNLETEREEMKTTLARLNKSYNNVQKENKSNSWLANDILNRSQHVLEGDDRSRDSRRLPPGSGHSKRDHTDDQSHLSSESASLQVMREKHRATERRLKKAISKGKPALDGPQRDLVDSAIRVSTANTHLVRKRPQG